MTWPVLFGLMLFAAGVAWYSVAVFIPTLSARAARPAAIKIAGALSFVAVLSLALFPVVEDGVWLVARLWTDGNHRLLIAIGYQEAPEGHSEVLGLAAVDRGRRSETNAARFSAPGPQRPGAHRPRLLVRTPAR